jgi:nucleoside-diphosphate-sugar epimerase
MRVFLTGATGFIGSALVPELIREGYDVVGLARSDAGAQTLLAAGAEVQRGDIEHLDSLRHGAAAADAVIHLAFNHDFSNYLANCEADRHVIEALGEALAGTNKLLIVTSGTGMANSAPGILATEGDLAASSKVVPRAATEEAVAAVAAHGVRTAIVRLGQIHDTVKQGLVTYSILVARQKGVSAYIGDGRNRWPAAHVKDTARLYRLALEKADAGDKFHAVAEEGVTGREIAEAIGQGLGVPVVSLSPEQAAEHFGWMATFAGWDIPASSEYTRIKLGWNPIGPSLLADLENMNYFAAGQ